MGLFDNLFGQKTETQQTTTTNQQQNPWAAQAPYLQDAFAKAQGVYNKGAGNVYNGQQVAQFTPAQWAALSAMANYGMGSNNAQTESSLGGASAASGAAGLDSAMSRLLAFKPGDGTQQNITNAGLYANNPTISGMTDAAMTDARNQFSEMDMPTLQRGAALTGNVDSNTVGQGGIAEGILQRGLAQKAADISANLRGNAWTQGLQTSEAGRQADNANTLSALQGAGGLGAQGLSTGFSGLSQGVSDQANLYNLAYSGGAGQQAGNQASIDNAKAMSEYGTDRLNSLLQQYYGIVGGNNWGGSTTGTQTTNGTQNTSQGLGTGIGSVLFGLGSVLKK